MAVIAPANQKQALGATESSAATASGIQSTEVSCFIMSPLELWKEVFPVMLSSHSNHLLLNTTTFILVGVPGLEAAHLWLAVPLSAMYSVALLGNIIIVTVIWTDSALHEPMYHFLCVLAAVDIVMSTSVIPKMLNIFWSGNGIIGFAACFTQMYIVHATTAIETGLLLAMAFDRYIAICKPLHYQTILTLQTMIGLGMGIIARAITAMTPMTWMVVHLPYCASHVVPHSYCEHMAVAKLACADHMPSSLYSLIVSFIIVGIDVIFIAISYSLILRAVFSLPSRDARVKALSTCGSHVSVMALFYLPGILSIYMAWLGQHVVPLHTQVLLADFYLVIPPMMNPLIYGLKTKHIRERVWNAVTNSLPGCICQNSAKEKRPTQVFVIEHSEARYGAQAQK
ncbi:olfactory receptor 52I1-like [Dromiciops gliroides]|uniref:olfactory receptor 52I1-like n=1 Tax=Dromiciops gliroides TaxID=33562 RepID=UPI001CC4C76B|nr:olfactory receptor 52I1-like [Dromiciops gliroides]